MSEFVECQACGRSFFAENLVCPYCKGGGTENGEEDDADDRPSRRAAAGSSERSGGLYGVIFLAFQILLAGIALLAFAGLTRPRAPQRFLLFEAATSILLLVGLALRRRWARAFAILFILVHAGFGIAAVLGRGSAATLVWGPGPAALLLFLLPFLSRRAREHFDR